MFKQIILEKWNRQVEVMCKDHMWKVGQKIGLWNIKTKIYWTIKGLIILFIKL